MTKFPEEVLTKTKRGELEVRWLVDRGHFVRYRYVNPESGKPMEGGKVKIVLRGKDTEEYFIIPVKGNRNLMLKAEEKGERKVWDGEKAVDIFE